MSSKNPYNNKHNNYINNEYFKLFQILEEKIKNLFINIFTVENNNKINNNIFNVAEKFYNTVNNSNDIESKLKQIIAFNLQR